MYFPENHHPSFQYKQWRLTLGKSAGLDIFGLQVRWKVDTASLKKQAG